MGEVSHMNYFLDILCGFVIKAVSGLTNIMTVYETVNSTSNLKVNTSHQDARLDSAYSYYAGEC